MTTSPVGLAAQNSEKSIELVAASTKAYGIAKRVWGLQLALAILVGIAGPVVAVQFPDLKVWSAVAGLVVLLLDTFLLEGLIQGHRAAGAKMQELFDTSLYGLPWNELVATVKPLPEEVVRLSNAARSDGSDWTRYKDWYPPVAATTALPLGVLVCQRSNASWDSSLRREFSFALTAVLFLVVGVGLVVGLPHHWSYEQWLLSLAVPVTPLAIRIWRDRTANERVSVDSGRLRDRLASVWKRALDGSLQGDALACEERLIQDDLYRRRSTSPFVPNWFYKVRRARHESDMNVTAEKLVAEANESVASL